MKGYKVTDKNRSKLIGIGCDSLKQLISKGKEKLSLAEEVVAALDDGTIIDDEDYFQALPPQTVIVLYGKNEEIVTGVNVILNALRSVNTTYLETGSKAKEFVLERTKELMEILKENQKEKEEKEKDLIFRNTREEDPEWFSDLETNARTKDEYMFKKSQDRIRGYFYKFQEDLRKNKLYIERTHFRFIVEQCLQFLRERLKEDEYFGCYFDRRCAGEWKDGGDGSSGPKRKKVRRCEKKGSESYDKLSYCDNTGKFVCQGKWRQERCELSIDHQINPYLSKPARIMFSTWNLDHRIERSRSVVPALVRAIEFCGKNRSINFFYFYKLLFTKFNLKLVHVVCHEKSFHDISCDPKSVYT